MVHRQFVKTHYTVKLPVCPLRVTILTSHKKILHLNANYLNPLGHGNSHFKVSPGLALNPSVR